MSENLRARPRLAQSIVTAARLLRVIARASGVSVGFLPLLDCAPLVVAAERGFAEAEGLDLILARENSRGRAFGIA